jgi:hypothetical protein
LSICQTFGTKGLIKGLTPAASLDLADAARKLIELTNAVDSTITF